MRCALEPLGLPGGVGESRAKRSAGPWTVRCPSRHYRQPEHHHRLGYDPSA